MTKFELMIQPAGVSLCYFHASALPRKGDSYTLFHKDRACEATVTKVNWLVTLDERKNDTADYVQITIELNRKDIDFQYFMDYLMDENTNRAGSLKVSTL
jgi:hypothetical protein